MYPLPIINFIIAHSQPIFCKGAHLYFKRAKGLSLLETISIAALLPELLRQAACNILVLDDMFGKYPVAEWVMKIRADFPEIKIMILTANTEVLYIKQLERCGATSFVHNSTEGFEIKTGLFKMMQGLHYKCPVIANAMLSARFDHTDGTSLKDPGLCNREKEALICLLKKMNIKDMMEQFGVTRQTIKQYRSQVKHKIKDAGYVDIFDYAKKTEIKY